MTRAEDDSSVDSGGGPENLMSVECGVMGAACEDTKYQRGTIVRDCGPARNAANPGFSSYRGEACLAQQRAWSQL